MTDVLLGFCVTLMVMAVLGAGPSLFMVRGKDRWGVALGICPVVGLVLISVAGTDLTLLDLPVSRWSTPAVIVGTLISIVLILLSVLHDRTARSEGTAPTDRTAFPVASRRQPSVPVGVFLITCALAMTPQIVGGLQYSILRGNGTDSFNYVTVAGYLDHEPYSWVSTTDLQSLVERHASYVRTRGLLTTRWTTMMTLAFASRLARVDPYKFEFSFSTLCMLLAFGPVFLWCHRLLDVPPLYSALTAAVVSAGFWGQLVLDLRADAQQNAVPVLLLLGFLVARIETTERDRMPWGEHVLLGLTATSLMLFYVEIVPMTMLGLLIFLAIRIRHGLTSRTRLAGWVFSACLALVAAIPMRHLLYRFGSQQMVYASHGINLWHVAYFPWLYSSPVTGLWGFGPLIAANTVVAHGFHLVLRPLGILLTIALVAAIASSTSDAASKRPGITLSAALAAAAIAQFSYLYSRDQLWAAAKGLSFGYPFLIICVVWYGLSREQLTSGGWRARWKAGIAISVSAFLAIQCALAFYRPWLAMSGAEYVGYIAGHGEYRRHDWNLGPFERVLRPQRGLTVWSDVSNPSMSDYIGLVLGWDVHLVNLAGSHEAVDVGAPRQHTDRHPDYLIVESSSFSAGPHHGGGVVVAKTADLALLRVDETPTIAGIENPNGLEGSTDAPLFWIGTSPTILHVIAPSNGCAVLRARFLLGPSRPDLAYRHLRLTAPADPARQHVLMKDGPQELHLRIARGLNDISLELEEKTAGLLPGEKPPLLLRVDDLRLEHEPCQNDNR
jgi:hypothetical protein